jgi:hypothetical protein
VCFGFGFGFGFGFRGAADFANNELSIIRQLLGQGAAQCTIVFDDGEGARRPHKSLLYCESKKIK